MPLTPDEQRILSDTHFLQTKNVLTEKTIRYFSEMERELHQEINSLKAFPFPKGTFLKGGKISKGEQYKSLPYFILDYPRLFTQKEIFAFRTMLWWGHEFSCTLHLSGPVLNANKDAIIKNLLDDTGVYFCVNDQPWDYYFEPDNYVNVEQLSRDLIEAQISNHGFIKISNYIPISEWDQYKSFTLETFARFLRYFY